MPIPEHIQKGHARLYRALLVRERARSPMHHYFGDMRGIANGRRQIFELAQEDATRKSATSPTHRDMLISDFKNMIHQLRWWRLQMRKEKVWRRLPG